MLTRLRNLPVGGWLQSLRISWPNILGSEVTGGTTPLYLPGTILVVAAVFAWWLHRMNRDSIVHAVADSSRTLMAAGFVLVFTVPMVRVYINSGVNQYAFPDGSTLASNAHRHGNMGGGYRRRSVAVVCPCHRCHGSVHRRKQHGQQP